MTVPVWQFVAEQAARLKALMARSAVIAERARTINENYLKTLATFEEHIERISKEDAALQATMAAMGNAGPELEDHLPSIMRSRMRRADGHFGEIASARCENGVIVAIRLQVGRHLGEWLQWPFK